MLKIQVSKKRKEKKEHLQLGALTLNFIYIQIMLTSCSLFKSVTSQKRAVMAMGGHGYG